MSQQLEPSIKPIRLSVAPFLVGLTAIIIFGTLAGFIITLLNSQQRLKAEIAGLRESVTKPAVSPSSSEPVSGQPPTASGSQSSSSASQANISTTSTVTTQPSSATWANSPSRPSQTHPVEKGETLFSIGQKYSIEWTMIVKANGLADENLIKAGDILVVPTVDAKSGINQVDFTTDAEKAKTLQAQAAVSNPWRFDPIEVAKRESGGVFGLTVNDQWVLGSKSGETGQATVRVAQGDKQYEVMLIQPVEKGEQGIWAITTIKPAK